MKTDPLLQEAREARVELVAGRTGTVSTILRRIGARILHELRGALPPTIFFFVGFNFIVLTTNLLVADYAVAVSNFILATVAALVVVTPVSVPIAHGWFLLQCGESVASPPAQHGRAPRCSL